MLMFVSDIHGSETAAERAVEFYKSLKCDKMIILGDILYHGARNDLPEGYNPKGVIKVLNGISDEIIAVRGNCDSEVDQMVLNFPCMSDYMLIFEKERCFFITHGHKYNMKNPPRMSDGDILIHGHTHVHMIEEFGEKLYINPGSVAMPKEGNAPTFMIYDDGIFTIYDFDMNIIRRRGI